MRPALLNPLFCSITTLSGIGPKLAPLYAKLVGERVVDLLWHRPSGIIDRRYCPPVRQAVAGKVATLMVQVDQHQPPDGPRRPYRVRCRDQSGFLILTFFHARDEWVLKNLPIGEWRVVSGVVEHFNNEIHMTHPDHMVPLEDKDKIAIVEPVYPLTGGLTSRLLHKTIRQALDRTPDMPEWQDGAWLARQNWPSWHTAIHALHAPSGEEQDDPYHPVRRRLAYDELLSNQLALHLVRLSMRTLRGEARQGDGHLRQQIIARLPFDLTQAQERAIAEIDADLAAPIRMLRLLQGDVGSGKTVVALMTMLTAVETGAQAALMAPTEILARQHLATLQPLADTVGIKIALLTGRDKGKARQTILSQLADGTIQMILGTHALFQADVQFHNLGVAVIDEQHRFGVQQRLDLAAKGRAVDVLVMTATPIPRTLLLTAYGDMDVSRLDEKPPGRQPVDTRILPLSRLEDVIHRLYSAIQGGARIYWVCPLVEESETSDLAAAEQRHEVLQQFFGDRVGLVHGKMRPTAKDQVMEAFAKGDLDILVATTVIEVGVNVPEASVMVIEHAERFGLAQLHQLRGRVGRGMASSVCLLLYAAPLSETSRARLEIMRSSEDGFLIAEEDLRLRGGGEILGTRQSGLPEFHLADLSMDDDLLAVARDDAKLIVERDRELSSPRGQALRVLLYLFDRDAAVKTLRSG